jgi:hypothetical protein
MGLFDFLKRRSCPKQADQIIATDSNDSIESQAIPIAQSPDSNPSKAQEFRRLGDSSDSIESSDSSNRFNRVQSLPSELPKDAEFIDSVESSDSNHFNRMQQRIDQIKNILAAHDRYVREKVARELTVEQLVQAIQAHLPIRPTAKTDLEAMKKLSENHKKLLAILIHDPTTFYDYQQLADMTRLSPDGVRGMISELSRMGYQFKKTYEGRKAKIQLIHVMESEKRVNREHSGDPIF